MAKYLIALIAALPLVQLPVAHGAQPAAQPDDESPWRLGIALGYGKRTNPLALSDDITIVIDVDVAWFGRRWFFDNGDLGITLLDRDALTLNLTGRLNSDRVFFGKTNTDVISVIDAGGAVVTERIEVPDRSYAFELGLEALADGHWGYLQAALNRDVSGTHDGYEIFVNYGRGFRAGRWLFEPSVGVSWKSDKLNDYYWGVRDHEANLLFPAYSAGSGLNRHARFLTSYQVTRHWAAVFVAEYERLNSEAAVSPIVDEQDVFGAYAGLSYRF